MAPFRAVPWFHVGPCCPLGSGVGGRSLPLSPFPLCKHTSPPGAAVRCRQPESRKGGEVAQLLSPSQQVWLALPGRWLRAWQRRAAAPGAAGSIRSRAKSGDAEQRGQLTGGERGSDLPCQAQLVPGTPGLCTHLGGAASSCIPRASRERCWQGSAAPWGGQVSLGDKDVGCKGWRIQRRRSLQDTFAPVRCASQTAGPLLHPGAAGAWS